MFKPGDLIVYGRTGVCRVEAIQEEGRRCYLLSPLFQQCSIVTPVNGVIPMRPILSKEEAEALIDRLPALEAKPVTSKVLRELTTRYLEAVSSSDTERIAILSMSIYAKKQMLAREKRRLGAIDERFLREAETLLFGELGTALGIAPEEVPGYIQARLAGLKGEMTLS